LAGDLLHVNINDRAEYLIRLSVAANSESLVTAEPVVICASLISPHFLGAEIRLSDIGKVGSPDWDDSRA
jgi:hypothetical protein